MYQSCPTLSDPMDCSPPGSSVHEVLQARILEWLGFPNLGDRPNPGIEPMSLESPASQADTLLGHLGSLYTLYSLDSNLLICLWKNKLSNI